MHSAIGIKAFDPSQLQAKARSQHNLPTTLHALLFTAPYRPVHWARPATTRSRSGTSSLASSSIPSWSCPTTRRRTPCGQSHWVARTGSTWAASKPVPRSPPSSPPSKPVNDSTSRSETISLKCCLAWLTYRPRNSTNLHLPHGRQLSSFTPPLGCSDAYNTSSP
jgi:hypothetical protein